MLTTRISNTSPDLGDSVTVYHALMHRVAAAADMPVTELFGMSPSGLSTDDQSGTRRFYDKITAEERQGEQGRALDRVRGHHESKPCPPPQRR